MAGGSTHFEGWRRSIMIRSLCVPFAIAAVQLAAQSDPGPRGGSPGAGGPAAGLSPTEQTFFSAARDVFTEINSVKGTIVGEDSQGLGPAFNGNSCAQCHLQPDVGGSSPGLTSKQNPMANPQVALATLDGATNTVPSFITTHGPVREARFVRIPGTLQPD